MICTVAVCGKKLRAAFLNQVFVLFPRIFWSCWLSKVRSIRMQNTRTFSTCTLEVRLSLIRKRISRGLWNSRKSCESLKSINRLQFNRFTTQVSWLTLSPRSHHTALEVGGVRGWSYRFSSAKYTFAFGSIHLSWGLFPSMPVPVYWPYNGNICSFHLIYSMPPLYPPFFVILGRITTLVLKRSGPAPVDTALV